MANLSGGLRPLPNPPPQAGEGTAPSPAKRGRAGEGANSVIPVHPSPMREGQNRSRARYLRETATDAERLLWRELRNKQLRGFRFRRQVSIGPYFADFACLEAKLIVEVD